MIRRKKHKRQLTVYELLEPQVSLKDLQDILLYLYDRESVLLGIMLAEAAIERKSVSSYRKAMRLLELAMEPPGCVSKHDLEAAFAGILGKLPREVVIFIIDFITGIISENAQYLSENSMQ